MEPPFAPLKLVNFAPIAAAFGFPPIFLFRENRAAAVRAGWLLPGLGRMVTHNLCASPGGARLMVKQEQGRRFLAQDGGWAGCCPSALSQPAQKCIQFQTASLGMSVLHTEPCESCQGSCLAEGLAWTPAEMAPVWSWAVGLCPPCSGKGQPWGWGLFMPLLFLVQLGGLCCVPSQV